MSNLSSHITLKTLSRLWKFTYSNSLTGSADWSDEVKKGSIQEMPKNSPSANHFVTIRKAFTFHDYISCTSLWLQLILNYNNLRKQNNVRRRDIKSTTSSSKNSKRILSQDNIKNWNLPKYVHNFQLQPMHQKCANMVCISSRYGERERKGS